MPKQVGKSVLSAKLGAAYRKAFDAHKADETTYGAGGDLPAGIEGGLAQLVDCKIDQYKKGDNKGELFFYAAGVVVEPKEFEGIPIEGLRTSIMEPLCNTPSRTRESLEEHVSWVLNEMRKLGVATEELGADDLEATVEALKESQPPLVFRFRTWKGDKATSGPYKDREPRVQHEWRGLSSEVPDLGSPVVDESEGAAGVGDIDALAAAADEGDEEAASKLHAIATEAGLDPDDLETWVAVAEKLAGDGEASEDKSPQQDPEKGDVWKYKALGKKKAIDVEVTAVFASKRLANVKSLDDGKTYKSVPFDKLEPPE